MGIRVAPDIEMGGVDQEMGVPAYTESTDLLEGGV